MMLELIPFFKELNENELKKLESISILKKYKKILVILIIFHKFARKICFMGEKYPCGKRLFYS